MRGRHTSEAGIIIAMTITIMMMSIQISIIEKKSIVVGVDVILVTDTGDADVIATHITDITTIIIIMIEDVIAVADHDMNEIDGVTATVTGTGILAMCARNSQ